MMVNHLGMYRAATVPLLHKQKLGTLGTSELVKRDLKVTKKGPKLRLIQN